LQGGAHLIGDHPVIKAAGKLWQRLPR
jgi:hypothetical protein